MNTIRWGIIGCGSMGREHILNLAALGGAAVTALADTDAGSRDAARAICAESRFVPQVFEDVDVPLGRRLAVHDERHRGAVLPRTHRQMVGGMAPARRPELDADVCPTGVRRLRLQPRRHERPLDPGVDGDEEVASGCPALRCRGR